MSVVRYPVFIPAILIKYNKVVEDMLYIVQMAFKSYPGAMPYFDDLLRNEQFIELVRDYEDTDLLNYIQQRSQVVKRPLSPLFLTVSEKSNYLVPGELIEHRIVRCRSLE